MMRIFHCVSEKVLTSSLLIGARKPLDLTPGTDPASHPRSRWAVHNGSRTTSLRPESSGVCFMGPISNRFEAPGSFFPSRRAGRYLSDNKQMRLAPGPMIEAFHYHEPTAKSKIE
jgi:hypothetical protein